MPAPPGRTQINPSVKDEVLARLEELGRIYERDRYWVLNVLLEYAVRHAKRAMDESHETAKQQYKDEDD